MHSAEKLLVMVTNTMKTRTVFAEYYDEIISYKLLLHKI